MSRRMKGRTVCQRLINTFNLAVKLTNYSISIGSSYNSFSSFPSVPHSMLTFMISSLCVKLGFSSLNSGYFSCKKR